ncbi:MAG TPA: T9SS type A sorting domain-containing protein [Mucilaginibacter sp.]
MKKQFKYSVAALLLFTLSINAKAQAPNISYVPSAYVFTSGTAISTISPTNTGGSVPANTYGQVTTFAGNTNGNSGTGNGTGTGARFNGPLGIVEDASGNLFVTDGNNSTVRKITPAGVVSNFATGFNTPEGIAIDASGILYVSDYVTGVIKKITPAGIVSTFVTGLTGPAGLCFDNSGNLLVADQDANQIKKITPAGVISIYAGSGAQGPNNSTNVLTARFNNPMDVQVDAAGNVFVADYGNNEIREISASNGVTTFAGSTTNGRTNGTGTAARFYQPTGIAMDGAGNFYIADYGNNEIREITPAGVVTLVAGNAGGNSGTTNGITTAARFHNPIDLCIDASGNAYIADYTNNNIRLMTLSGYAIDNTPPNNLTFDATTGSFSGTPLSPFTATTYTVTAYNYYGSSSTTISLACGTTRTWDGSRNTDWGTGQNWSGNTVPNQYDNVQIGTSAFTNQPKINTAVTVNSITFGKAAFSSQVTLSMASGTSLTVSKGITVNSGATPTIAGAGTTPTVTLQPGSLVTITGTGTLTLNTPLSVTLQSDATGDASIGPTVPGAITGTAASSINVQRYLSGGSAINRGYRLLSSPVSNGTDTHSNKVYSINYLKNSIYLTATTTNGGFDNTSPANPTLYLYREDLLTASGATFTSGDFRGINNINSSPSYTIDVDGSGFYIPQGNGYLCFYRGNRSDDSFTNETKTTYVPQPTTLSTSGTLNIGQVPVKLWFTPTASTLSYTDAAPASGKGFNLMGNPYPCAIDWDTFQTSSTTSGIYGTNTIVGSTIYVLDPVSKNFGTYTANSGGTGTLGATNVISSGQGFFVLVSNTGGQLIFNESAKTTTSQNTGTNLLMGKPANVATAQYLKLRLAKDSISTDETMIKFNSQATLNYNVSTDAIYKTGYGAVSMSNLSADNINLAIHNVPLPKLQAQTIGLSVSANATGIYSISLKDIVSVPRLYDVWLMDNYKKDSLDMRQNITYQFYLNRTDTSSFGSKRFTLVLRQNQAYAYRLLNFNATKVPEARQVQVVWNTMNEENYTNFTVERSTDNGATFSVLGGVDATGAGKYSFVDQSPSIGTNLYRLKQEDINNTISYSKIVTIQYANTNTNLAGNNLSIFPNPVSNNINVAINAQNNTVSLYNIRFMSTSGRLVKEATTSQPSWQGTTENLQPGTYIIQVFDNKTQNLVGENKFVKL